MPRVSWLLRGGILPAMASPMKTNEPISVARRPVFDLSQKVVGCQIWSEFSESIPRQNIDGASAVRKTIHTAVNVVGLDRLLGDHELLLLGVASETLIEGTHTLCPPDRTVLMLDSETRITPQLSDACAEAKDTGYTIALDHRALSSCGAMLSHVSMVSMDLGDTKSRATEWRCVGDGVRLIVTGVETPEDFAAAQDAGASFVQGYFFCRTTAVLGRAPVGITMTHQALLAEVSKSQVDLNRIAEIIGSDPALSYHILRFINSTLFGLRERIVSIGHALSLLGERHIKRWGSLTAISAVSGDKPPEVLMTCLVRSHFCEGLARLVGRTEEAHQLFLTGLLSTIDVMTDMTMEEVVDLLPITADVRAGLLQDDATLTARALAMARACERGDWGDANVRCAELGLSRQVVASLYYESLGYARDLVRG